MKRQKIQTLLCLAKLQIRPFFKKKISSFKGISSYFRPQNREKITRKMKIPF
jgi:hypothetical protein